MAELIRWGKIKSYIQTKYIFLMLLPIIVILVAFLILPFLSIMISSFTADSGRFTLEYYRNSFQKLYLIALKNSLVLAISTTIIGMVVGSLIAFVLVKTRPKLRNFVLSLTSVPLTFSGIVIAYSFIVMLGSSGTITLIIAKVFKINPLKFSSFLYTWKGLLVAYLYFQIPRMVLIMVNAWTKMDWSLVEAAQSLGAGHLRILRRVIIPYIKASILAGSILLFAVSMGAFGTALALTGPGVNIFPLTVYTQISDVSYNLRQADALVIILTLVTATSIYIYRRLFTSK